MYTVCRQHTRILWEADSERRLLNLFFKEIFLVEKENNGCVCEPFVVADRVEQLKTFLHSILQKRQSQTVRKFGNYRYKMKKKLMLTIRQSINRSLN